MEKLMDLPNIGKVTAQNLIASGVNTVEDFLNIGAKASYIKVRQSADPSAWINVLLGLVGAEMGIKKKEIPSDIVNEMKEFFKSI